MWSYSFLGVRQVELLEEIQKQRRKGLFAGSITTAKIEGIPHVDDCEMCSECRSGDSVYEGLETRVSTRRRGG